MEIFGMKMKKMMNHSKQFDFIVVDNFGNRCYLSIEANNQEKALDLAIKECKKYNMRLLY